MAVIKFLPFFGEAPIVHPTMLQNGQGQVAKNMWITNGTLTPINAPTQVANAAYSIDLALFRYTPSTGGSFWFESNVEADFVRSPVAQDAYNRVFWTDGTDAKYTGSAIATSAPPYPSNWYKLGIPVPNNPTAVVGGSPSNPTDLAETRFYLLTVVDIIGEEGPASLTSNKVDVRPGEYVTVTMAAQPDMTNRPLTAYRLYRSSSGTYGSAFLFVAEFPISTATYVDSKLSSALGAALATEDWVPPPSGLTGLTVLPGGVLAGFVKNTLCFSEPGFPYAWPIKYQRTTDYPIVGIGVFGNSVLVATTGQPYVAQGIDPANMSMVKLDINQACVSRKSMVDFGDSVVYASPVGLISVSAQGARILTSGLLTRNQWQAYAPTSLRAWNWEGKYLASYDNGADRKMFVINPDSPDEGLVHFDLYATAGYTDLNEDRLYLAIGPQLYSWNTGSPQAYTWKSKAEEAGPLANFGCLQVFADTYPVTVDYYGDGNLVYSATVTSPNFVRLPAGTLYWRHEVMLSGSGVVYTVNLAENPSDLKTV